MRQGETWTVITLTTLFDSKYMAKGLSLIASLRRHAPDSVLYVLTLDEKTRDYFEDVTIKGVVPIHLSDILGPELFRARMDRSKTEFIWTLASYFTQYCVDMFKPTSIAYIDADCYFFSDPAPLYDEVVGYPVAITPHRYTPYQEARLRGAGVYNVGWVYFEREGFDCLRHWRTQCLEWCYHQIMPDGRMADQGYLNDWPQKWGAHVVYNLGVNLAPWNQEQYSYSFDDGRLCVSDGRRDDALILYHFHGFISDTSGKVVQRTGYPLNEMVEKYVYRPYENEILSIVGNSSI
jgi:hypothetical protein